MPLENDKEASDFYLNPQQAGVDYADGKYFLTSSGRERIEISEDEANYYINTDRASYLAEDAAHHGIFFSNVSDEIPARKKTESAKLANQIPKDGLCVFLDTTTVRNALDCIEGYCLPVQLLDLSIFTFAMVFYDYVIVQNSRAWTKFDFNTHKSELRIPRDIVKEITFPDEFIPNTLWTMCVKTVEGQTDISKASEEYSKAWESMLGIPAEEIHVDLRKWNKYQDSPNYWSGFFADDQGNGSGFNQEYLGAGQLDDDARDFLSLTTMRTLFNDSLAGFLHIPYFSSSFRACIHSKIISEKVRYRHVIDCIISEIVPVSESASDGPYMQELGLPFVLGMVLKRMSVRSDYWTVLEEIRRDAQPFRNAVCRDREECDASSSEYMERYKSNMKSLSNDWHVAEEAILSSASAGATLVTATPGHTAAFGLILKFIRLLNPHKKVRRFYLKNFKPEIFFLMSVSDESRRLLKLEDQISKIWGDHMTRQRHDLLTRLSELYPASFLRLPRA